MRPLVHLERRSTTLISKPNGCPIVPFVSVDRAAAPEHPASPERVPRRLIFIRWLVREGMHRQRWNGSFPGVAME